MTSLTDAVNLLRAAAQIAENGHAAGARRVAEHAVKALLEVENREPEHVAEVLARREWNVSGGEG
jgi:hypothetical protein